MNKHSISGPFHQNHGSIGEWLIAMYDEGRFSEGGGIGAMSDCPPSATAPF